MTKLNQVYKCNVCGNIVIVTHAGAGELVCCGQPMQLQKPNTVDAAIEKHVPVVTKTDKGVKVTVGETMHPMDPDHYIEWIAVISKGQVYFQHLLPGDAPVAGFCCLISDKIEAFAYCNLHGLWKSK